MHILVMRSVVVLVQKLSAGDSRMLNPPDNPDSFPLTGLVHTINNISTARVTVRESCEGQGLKFRLEANTTGRSTFALATGPVSPAGR